MRDIVINIVHIISQISLRISKISLSQTTKTIEIWEKIIISIIVKVNRIVSQVTQISMLEAI